MGNSIRERGEWSELLENGDVKNRGMSGDSSWGVYDRMCVVVKGKGGEMFVMIGMKKVGEGECGNNIGCDIEEMIEKIKKE